MNTSEGLSTDSPELNSRFPSNTGGRHQLPRARAKLAYLSRHVGRHDEAASSYPQVLEGEDENVARFRTQYAELLLELNRHVDAETQLKLARGIMDGQDAESRRESAYFDYWMAHILTAYGRICYQTARFETAEEYLTQAISVGETLTETPFGYIILGWSHYHLSEAYILSHRFAEAERQARLCLECWSSSHGRMFQHNAALAIARLGELYQHRGDYDKAEQHFRQARDCLTEISNALPNEPYCQTRLIVLLANCPEDKIRNPTLAVDLARKVNTHTDGLMWRYLALSQYRSGAWEAAKFSIEQSMKLRNEGDPLDRILLAMAQFQLGNQTEATKLYTQAVKDAKTPIYYGHVRRDWISASAR